MSKTRASNESQQRVFAFESALRRKMKLLCVKRVDVGASLALPNVLIARRTLPKRVCRGRNRKKTYML
jgi:hypothetical protein